jgi:hypothetical protein
MQLAHAKLTAPFVILIVIFSVFSCSNDNPNDSDVGQISVKITDAPFPINMVEYAEVTINKVEIRSAASEDESSYMTLTDEDFSATFDLLLLQNGATANLIEMDIPVGSYDLVRLHVDTAEVKVIGGDVYYLKVPSGSQTGIKVFVNQPIEVVGGLSAELLLDFDINRSFVVQGNPGTPAGINGFNFTPVIRAVNQSETGRISGYVRNNSEEVITGATVYTEIAPEDTLFTTTDVDGFYALVGLDPGPYFVTAQEAAHDTVKVENIEVVIGNNTEQGFELTPK